MKKTLRYIVLLCTLTACCVMQAQEKQTNPYIDDRPWNIGYYIGTNFMSMRVQNAKLSLGDLYQDATTTDRYFPEGGSATDTISANVYYMVPGLSVGFIFNWHLTRHLDIRVTPGLQFAYMPLHYTYQTGSDKTVSSMEKGIDGNSVYSSTLDMLLMPFSVPVFLRWATERYGNFRPYVLGGGGVSFRVFNNKKYPVNTQFMDAFVEVGAGCDFYMPTLKFSPQLTYRFGFMNQLAPNADRLDDGLVIPENMFYTDVINKMFSHEIVLIFNIE